MECPNCLSNIIIEREKIIGDNYFYDRKCAECGNLLYAIIRKVKWWFLEKKDDKHKQ